MTVHMVRVVTSPENVAVADVNAAIRSWAANNDEWAGDPEPHVVTDVADGEVSRHYAGTFRFNMTRTADELLAECEATLQQYVSWYRLGYHACAADEAMPSSCAWERSREWAAPGATIPSDIPTFA